MRKKPQVIIPAAYECQESVSPVIKRNGIFQQICFLFFVQFVLFAKEFSFLYVIGSVIKDQILHRKRMPFS